MFDTFCTPFNLNQRRPPASFLRYPWIYVEPRLNTAEHASNQLLWSKSTRENPQKPNKKHVIRCFFLSHPVFGLDMLTQLMCESGSDGEGWAGDVTDGQERKTEVTNVCGCAGKNKRTQRGTKNRFLVWERWGGCRILLEVRSRNTGHANAAPRPPLEGFSQTFRPHGIQKAIDAAPRCGEHVRARRASPWRRRQTAAGLSWRCV